MLARNRSTLLLSDNIPRKQTPIAAWLGIGALSLFLGIASGFGPEGFSRMPALLHTVLIAATQVLFFLVLPKRMSQPIQILAAMVLGILAGVLLSKMGETLFVNEYLGIFGTVFILLLKLVIIPLIFVSIVCGVAGIGDTAKLGRLGGKAVAYYLCTTFVAVMIGMICVNLLKPGAGVEKPAGPEVVAETEEGYLSVGRRLKEQILPGVIQNPIMAGQSPLVIIFFALVLGAALAARKKESAAMMAVFEGLDKAFIQIVLWVMLLAPIGVFALMAQAIAVLGIDYLGDLAKYCLTVLLGLGLHWCLLVFAVLGLGARFSPMRFVRGMAPAMQLAFSTSSSTATLPVTIRCASRRIGVDEDVAGFVLPIGATINMDGTGMYQAIAAIFIAEVYGIDLSMGQQFAIFITAITMSIGAAGIPGVGLSLLSVVLMSAGLPVEGLGIVAGVDRLLDMCRTLLNVTGDSVGAILIAKSEGALGEPPEDAAA